MVFLKKLDRKLSHVQLTWHMFMWNHLKWLKCPPLIHLKQINLWNHITLISFISLFFSVETYYLFLFLFNFNSFFFFLFLLTCIRLNSLSLSLNPSPSSHTISLFYFMVYVFYVLFFYLSIFSFCLVLCGFRSWLI